MDRTFETLAAVGTCSTPSRFSTQALHPRDQFDAWREKLSSNVDLLPAGQPTTPFPAEAEEWSIGDIRLCRFDLKAAPARAWRHRPRAHSDDWCLVFAWAKVSDPEPLVTFRSLALPFEGRSQDAQVITLHLPRRSDPSISSDLDEAHGQLIQAPQAALLTDFVLSLARRLPDMTGPQLAAASDPVRAFVTACIAPQRDRLAEASAPLASLLMSRARHVIRQNMASPEFGPSQLVRLLAVSRSKLYRLAEPLGGVAAFIQRERLLRARRMLEDPSELRSVNMIAADVGFLDHSTFSRAFRREFALSPTEAREIALAQRVTRWQPGADETEARSYL